MAASLTSRLRCLLGGACATGVLAVVLSGYLVHLAELRGLTSGLNELTYAHVMRVKPQSSIADAQVLLVYCEPSLYQDQALVLRLLQALDPLEPSAIGLTVPYETLSADLTDWNAATRRLVCAAPLHPYRNPSQKVRLGDVELIHPQRGLYLQHRGRRCAGDNRLSSLEAILSWRVGVPPANIPQGDYFVNFRGTVGSLPHVNARMVLRGELTSELVRGRVVLVGLTPDPLLPGVATPTTAGSQWMSLLEFRGHALNTILTQRVIRPPGTRTQPFLYLGCALVCVVTLRQSNLRSAVLLLLGLSTFSYLTAWIAMHYLFVWIPLASLFLVQLLSALLVLNQRLNLAESAWTRLAQKGFATSPRYRNHPPLAISRDSWQDAGLMIDQLFGIQRGALLISRRGRRRLHRVLYLRCGPAEIVEVNRNLRRAPYADAVEKRGLLRVDETRPFFQCQPHEQQFLVPLLHRGQVKGVLALALTDESLRRTPDFAEQARRTADELAELATRREAVQQLSHRQDSWIRWLWTVPEQRSSGILQQHLGLVDRRLNQTCQANEESVVAEAMYDLCGRLVSMNAAMFCQLLSEGLASMDVQLVELVARLSRRGPDETRSWLRSAILEQRLQVIPLPPSDTNEARTLLLRPLRIPAPTPNPPWSFEPFRTQGIQLQLMDASRFRQLMGKDPPSGETSLEAIRETLEQIQSLVGNRA